MASEFPRERRVGAAGEADERPVRAESAQHERLRAQQEGGRVDGCFAVADFLDGRGHGEGENRSAAE